MNIYMASAAVVVMGGIAARFRFLQKAQRLLIYTRAAGYMVAHCARRCAAERSQWPYFVERARRDA